MSALKLIGKSVFLLLVIVLVFLGIGIFLFVYGGEFGKTAIIESTSPDGQYRLEINQLGSPDWPFGSTHCEFRLYRGKEKITVQEFSLRDDGAHASPSNFSYSWEENRVRVLCSASEQKDEFWNLYYDGTTGRTPELRPRYQWDKLFRIRDAAPKEVLPLWKDLFFISSCG